MTGEPHPYADWLALAFDQTPALRAGEAIEQHRQARESAGLFTRSYEVVLPSPLPPLRAFLDAMIPKLANHLECLRLSPRGTPGVFLSVFDGGRLYFIGSEQTVQFQEALRRKDPPVALLPGRMT